MPPSERSYYTDSIDFSRKKDAELYLNRLRLSISMNLTR